MTSLRDSRIAFADYMHRVCTEVAAMDFADYEPPWFRGHSQPTHTLTPTLMRKSTMEAVGIDVKQVHDKASAARQRMLRLESDLFFDFQIRMGRERADYASCWDVLFAMRHYGIPTRIMDWTQTLGVAIYFALSAPDPVDPGIWILHPYLLNKKHWISRDTVLPKYLGFVDGKTVLNDYDDILGHWKHDSMFEGPVAVCPSRANARMQAQSGTFTIHGTNWRPLEQQVDGSIVRMVPMPSEAVLGGRQFLREAGLTDRVLFPGIEGLAQEMRRTFELRR